MASTAVLVLYYAALVLPYIAVLGGVVSLLVPRREAQVAETMKQAA